MPTTIGAVEWTSLNFPPPAWRSIASRSIANRSIAKPRERKVRNTKSWIACSAPRIEGKRTNSWRIGDLLGEAGLDRSDDRIARIGIP